MSIELRAFTRSTHLRTFPSVRSPQPVKPHEDESEYDDDIDIIAQCRQMMMVVAVAVET